MISGVEYRKIGDRSLHIMVSGDERMLEVDRIVICAGQESLTELLPAQKIARGPRFHLIGGARHSQPSSTPSGQSAQEQNWRRNCK